MAYSASGTPASSAIWGVAGHRWTAVAHRQLLLWGPALLAGALAVVVNALGWQGTDHAAQAYRVEEVRQHGLVLWDSGWYGGNYPLSYSVVFPLLGALLSLPVVAVLSAAAATGAFDRLVTSAFGSRPLGSWYFAVSTVLPVAIGQLPFLCGEAAGLAAVLVLAGRRRSRPARRLAAVALGVFAALCSPLAAAFLILACLVWAGVSYASGKRASGDHASGDHASGDPASGDHGGWHPLASHSRPAVIALAVAAAAVVGVLAVVFPGTGSFPFPWSGLPGPLLLCAVLALPLLGAAPVIRWAALVYALACLASFLIPNPLGGNAPRLGAAVGVPLLACILTRRGAAVSWATWTNKSPKIVVASVLVPFVIWQWAPGMQVDTSGASTQAALQRLYQPLIAQLARREAGPMRVEVVPTKDHWEAASLAPQISLARGWERQLDIADDPLFYGPGGLTPASYRQWLVDNGIQWVALPSVALDYAGEAEATLLRQGGVGDLRLAWASPDWRLWRMTDSPGLVSGPGRLSILGPDHLVLQAGRPGTLLVRVRYTGYWQVSSGQACVTASPDGWTTVEAHKAGMVSLTISLLPHSSSACP
ncbi:MAG: hypothetical protein ACR2KC_04595 [Acidimicrobiales bacterium]